MTRRARRGSIYAGQIDQSWQKFARCTLCGYKTCINNYADRKTRIPRTKGVFLCAWCSSRALFPLECYLFVKETSKSGCKKGTDCGKCKPCKARLLLEARKAFYHYEPDPF